MTSWFLAKSVPVSDMSQGTQAYSAGGGQRHKRSHWQAARTPTDTAELGRRQDSMDTLDGIDNHDIPDSHDCNERVKCALPILY